jgi:hypothetical protein
MASRAEVYRLRALESEAAAKTATDYKIRVAYINLANEWRELARKVEKWQSEEAQVYAPAIRNWPQLGTGAELLCSSDVLT